MRTSEFADFYMLSATLAHAEITHEPFRHSHIRWLRDANQTFRDLTENMAIALRDYLFLSAMGESRHAEDSSEGESVPYLENTCRKDVYHEALQFSPEKSWPVLVEIFDDQNWSRGYGGESWARIAHAIGLYYNPLIPDAVFVDHCADLRHNGGCAFNKRVDNEMHWRDVFSPVMTNFLSWKAEVDILTEKPSSHVDRDIRLWLTAETLRLLRRFQNLFGVKVWIADQLSTQRLTKQTAVKWGDKTLQTSVGTTDPRCDKCGNDASWFAEDKELCESCFSANYFHCKECQEICFQDDAEEFEGDLYCEGCLSAITEDCDECGEWVKETLTEHYELAGYEKHTYVVRVYTQQICAKCVDTKGYFHCSYCDGVFEFEQQEGLCPSCAKEDLPRCDNCGKVTKSKTWGLCHECFGVMALLPTMEE